MPSTPPLFSLSGYVSLSEDAQALLLATQIAVAAGFREPEWAAIEDALDEWDVQAKRLEAQGFQVGKYLESLRLRTHHWRTMLAEHRLDVDDMAMAALSMELCTTSVVLEDAEELDTVEAIRRLDCIFDILEMSWSAQALTDVFAGAGQALEGAPTKDWLPGAVTGAKKAAEFLSFFHPIAGIAASTALELMPTEAAAAGASGPDDLARLVAYFSLFDFTEPVERSAAVEALGALTREADRTTRRRDRLMERDGDLNEPKVQGLLALQRYQAVAAGLLMGWSKASGEPQVEYVPSTVGQRLPHAKAMLAAVGVEVVSVLDAQAGPRRSIFSESNWVVVSQQEKAPQNHDFTRAVRLTVAKHSEWRI